MASRVSRNIKKVVPVVVICGLAYINYASMYRLGFHEIWKHHNHGVAVSLWVVLSVCEAFLLFYWAVMLAVGPGRASKQRPFDLYGTNDELLAPLPPVFVCDEYGFPFWCSNCNSIKNARVSHLSDQNACVPKFDHYCLWVGTVIGQRNHRPFIKFMWWLEWYLVALLSYLAAYTRLNIDKGLDHNFIVLYIMCGFWIAMITPLFAAHVWYIVHNRTTLGDMQKKRSRREHQRLKETKKKEQTKEAANGLAPRKDFKSMHFVNISYDNLRLVVPHTLNPYSFSFRKHWINMLCYNNAMVFYDELCYSNLQLAKSILIFCIPIIDVFFKEPNVEGQLFAPSFLDKIHQKAHDKRCYIPLYVRPPAEQSGSDAYKLDSHDQEVSDGTDYDENEHQLVDDFCLTASK